MSRPLLQSSLADEYVRVRVSATLEGNLVDPTFDSVQMAFMQAGAEPAGGDWSDAVWEVDQTTDPATYFAQCLVGPSADVTLADGEYAIWLKVIDSPESPVRNVGRLVIT